MANKKFMDETAAGALAGTETMLMSLAGAGTRRTLLSTIKTFILGVLGGFTVSTSATLTENSDTVFATQKAVKAYVDALLAASDAMVYKGATDCSGNPNYPAASAGWTYRVSVAGKIGGASGKVVEVGDWFVCNTDGTASGDEATVGTKWTAIQTNLDGAVIGPASAVSGNLACYSGTSGKLITDSGVALIAGVAGASTWAAIPAAGSVPKGTIWYVSDITSAGKFFKSDGTTRWYPLGGTENIYTLAAPVTGLCTTETVLGQVLIPANLLQVGDRLRVWSSWGKTGTTNSLIGRVRVGTAGTIADAIAANYTIFTTAQRSIGIVDDFVLMSATSLQFKGTANLSSYNPVASTNAPAAATTIPSASANALYLSITGLSNGSTDTISLEDCQVQLVSKT